MNKILSINQAVKITDDLRKQGEKIVLAGGCFDILHPGHVFFLEKAKKAGDVLFVMLESDETIRKQKGANRPIHTQKDRSLVLASLAIVDYVVLLPLLKTDKDYDDLLLRLKPTIIATTKGDPKRHHKVRQASLVGAKIVDVIERIRSTSTSLLAKVLSRGQSL